jgi:hypothetical protein
MWGGGGANTTSFFRDEEGIFGSQCVPMGTLSSQVVPNSTSVLSHMVYPKFNSHMYELKWWAIGEHNCSYFVTWGPKREANGKAQQAHMMGPMFSFLGWGGVGRVFFKKFLPCSQCVLSMFP